MSNFAEHDPFLVACRCSRCLLVACGAMAADWAGWRDVEIAGELRILMLCLTGTAPVLWPCAKRRYAGALDWFAKLGCGIQLEGDDHATR